jgi:hypothetical protein
MTVNKSYRNGVYVAFNGMGTSNPTESDIKYYYQMKAWRENMNIDFTFHDSHEKTEEILDTSNDETFKRKLNERLANSRTFMLIVSEKTILPSRWLDYELNRLIETVKIPIVLVLTDESIDRRQFVSGSMHLLPAKLRNAIKSRELTTLSVGFNKQSIKCAIEKFHVHNKELEPGEGYFC